MDFWKEIFLRFIIFFYFFKLINLFYFTILYWFCYTLNPPWVYMCSPSWTPFPPPSPSHPSGSSQCTSPKHPVMHQTWTGDSFHMWYYTCFNAILTYHHAFALSHRVQKMFNTSVSLLLSCIQGYRYLLSKFHIYALVYCTGVFLSGLLHSV